MHLVSYDELKRKPVGCRVSVLNAGTTEMKNNYYKIIFDAGLTVA